MHWKQTNYLSNYFGTRLFWPLDKLPELVTTECSALSIRKLITKSLSGRFLMAEDVDFMASKNVIGVINMCNEWAGPRRQYLEFGIEQIRLKTVDTMAPKVEDLEMVYLLSIKS